MTTNKRQTLSFALLFYFAGFSAGLFLMFIATWADLEASFYGFPRQADPGLTGFNCPVLMTPSDLGILSLSFTNTAEIKINPVVRVWVSAPTVAEERKVQIGLAPGESQEFEWTVDARNIDLKNFIFAKAMVFSAYPLPSLDATCGIFVLNLPVSGKALLLALIGVGFLGMGAGLFRMYKLRVVNEWVGKYFPALSLVTVILVLGLITSFRGAWVQAMLLFAVIVLLLIILLGSFLLYEERKL